MAQVRYASYEKPKFIHTFGHKLNRFFHKTQNNEQQMMSLSDKGFSSADKAIKNISSETNYHLMESHIF